MKKLTPKEILKKFYYAYSKRRAWREAARIDFDMVAGDQWDEEDIQKLADKGVKALTVNKLQANLFLVSGAQRQNKTQFRAFPEGEEDDLKAEIITRLHNDACKKSGTFPRSSEQFEDGVICGEGWLESDIDYTYDLLNGEMKIRKTDPFEIFPDPQSKEYDLSDARYVFKLKQSLTKDELFELFPGKEKIIKEITDGRINIDDMDKSGRKKQEEDYDKGEDDEPLDIDTEAGHYDLLEMYYKNYKERWFVADKKLAKVEQVKSEKDADKYIKYTEELDLRERIIEMVSEVMKQNIMNDIQEDPEQIEARIASQVSSVDIEQRAYKFKRLIPEIWCASLSGKTIIDDSVCDTYPAWRGYPFIPFFGHRLTVKLSKRKYAVKGIIRDLIPLQIEINKRKTQMLRIINSSANSGWQAEEGAWTNEEDVKQFGSSPGVTLYNKASKPMPKRIEPANFPFNYDMLVKEASSDMKEVSGINTDLLAMQSGGTDSGRAILIRQRQGYMMIQRLLDNFDRSMIMLGKFILTLIPKLYTVEKAMVVLGEKFIEDNFSVPDLTPDGQPQPAAEGSSGLKMRIDKELAKKVIALILNEINVKKYDVEIGQGIYTDTERQAAYTELLGLREKGVGIPDELLIMESSMSPGHKEKIKKMISNARVQADKAARMNTGAGAPGGSGGPAETLGANEGKM